MSETITATEIVDTKYGRKVYLDSPFAAKDYIKYLPFGDNDTPNTEELDEMPDFEFSKNFASHRKWNPDEGVWELDQSAFVEAREFFESVGFDVECEERVEARMLA